jgi:hypothetical protein
MDLTGNPSTEFSPEHTPTDPAVWLLRTCLPMSDIVEVFAENCREVRQIIGLDPSLV